MDNNQTSYDFMFELTPNQPWVFDALYGNLNDLTRAIDIPNFANKIGTLVCWAQSADDRTPRDDFKHLYGTALIVNGNNWVFYDAFSFANRGASYFVAYDADNNVVPSTDPNAVWGKFNLSGDTGMDACPNYLVGNFIPEGSSLAPGKPDLTLWPCKQDLRQDRIPTCTKAKFDIWNENEVKFTGTYQCFKCFLETFLSDIGDSNNNTRGKWLSNRGPGYGGAKFKRSTLQTDVARFRVQGVYSSVCIATNSTFTSVSAKTKDKYHSCPNINADGSKSNSFTTAWGTSSTITPLLGVLLYANEVTTLLDNQPIAIAPIAGHTLHGAGAATGNNSGFIKFDLGGGVETKPAQ